MTTRTFYKVEVPKRSYECAGNKEPLEPGSDCYSLLFDHEKEEGQFTRKDYCPACFEAAKESLKSAVTHWKARVPERAKEENIFRTKEEKALILLKELIESCDDQKCQEAFILALFLARQKVIALRREVMQEEGALFQLYEALESDEIYLVKKPNIATIPVSEVQKTLSESLR